MKELPVGQTSNQNQNHIAAAILLIFCVLGGVALSVWYFKLRAPGHSVVLTSLPGNPNGQAATFVRAARGGVWIARSTTLNMVAHPTHGGNIACDYSFSRLGDLGPVGELLSMGRLARELRSLPTDAADLPFGLSSEQATALRPLLGRVDPKLSAEAKKKLQGLMQAVQAEATTRPAASEIAGTPPDVDPPLTDAQRALLAALDEAGRPALVEGRAEASQRLSRIRQIVGDAKWAKIVSARGATPATRPTTKPAAAGKMPPVAAMREISKAATRPVEQATVPVH